MSKALFPVIIFLAATLLQSKVSSQPKSPTFIYSLCRNSDSGSYTANSAYETNLKAVLTELGNHAATDNFYYTSGGAGADTVHGQYHCRGDIDSRFCQNCIKSAVLNATNCSKARSGVILYGECTLRYKNESMHGISEERSVVNYRSPTNVTNPDVFSLVLNETMTTLIQEAVRGNDSSMATRERTELTFGTAYFLVQCSPDLSTAQCESCLRSAFDKMRTCCGKWPSGLFTFLPNCQVMYDTRSLFYFTSPVGSHPPPSSSKPKGYYVTRVVLPLAAVLTLLIAGGVWYYFHTKRVHLTTPSSNQTTRDVSPKDPGQNIESYSLAAIMNATTKFSIANKLGQGGFGSVYKGLLPNGEPVAVKRLIRYSDQRVREFKTEIDVVAKLQHTNLVRLVGYCIEQEERILIYEFLPNLSLDKFLFDTTTSINLDWRTRYKIIRGIACGLQYLHESLVPIIHRNLKSSNILLDDEMNPKIADFGLAKLFNIDETTGNTTRIAGTFGYMAPEYAMAGRYSFKSDIYSFGVIILEILSGKSVCHFYDLVTGNGLLLHAWRHWNERSIEGLIDPILGDGYSRTEVERCAQIGLLCVQDDTARRPSVGALMSMLESESTQLPSPLASSTFFSGVNITRSSNSQGEVVSQSSQVEYHHSSSSFHQLEPCHLVSTQVLHR